MYVYICVYICVCVCMCIYVYIYVYVMYVYIRFCLCAFVLLYVKVYACMFVYMYVFIDRWMYVYVCLYYVCVSISTMRVCLPYIALGFDVCSSIQEELQGREMASISSIVEGSRPTLMKTKTRWRQSILYSKINLPGKDNQLSYMIFIITNCSYIILNHERVQVGH